MPIIEFAPQNTSVLKLTGESGEILRFEGNGDIFLYDKLIENNLQVVEGFKEFLTLQGLYPRSQNPFYAEMPEGTGKGI